MVRNRPFITLDITPAACVVFALTLLIVPVQWILAWMIASAIHELGHYVAIRLTRGNVYSICVGSSGMKMKVGPMSAGAEILCAAAGPIAGGLLLCLARWAPRVALCGGIQSIYNLLPMYPMDGGRILDGLLRGITPLNADTILKWVRIGVLSGLFALSVYAFALLKLGAAPLILYAVLLWRTQKIKIPCKAGRMRVQ